MRRAHALVLVLAVLFVALAPSQATALEFEIDNESDRNPDDVYITVSGADAGYDVPGFTNNVPVKLSSIPANTIQINKLISGRVYVSYEKGVTVSEPFDSTTRFDWAELTVTPSSADVANLTAVDQFAIGMRLDTYDAQGTQLERIGSANSNTIFDALQQIPGGPEATVKDGDQILRVLSPNKSDVYPLLDEYVKSMDRQTITLATAFYGSPFTTSSYSGTFTADGSITLSGSTNPFGMAPETIDVDGQQLIADIYTGGNTPNNAQGAIYRDLLAGFSTGLWGGVYGNDALDFCTNPNTTAQGSWCPSGFNQPAFGDARAQLETFPTCEQYAAVINKYSDSYGNPYSDASKKVTVSLNQPSTGGEVDTLKLTILPDSGNAQPVQSGNDNCGAKDPTPPPPPPPVDSVKINLKEKAKFNSRKGEVGSVKCSKECGQILVKVKRNGHLAAKLEYRLDEKSGALKSKLTKWGNKKLNRQGHLKGHVFVTVHPDGEKKTEKQQKITLKR